NSTDFFPSTLAIGSQVFLYIREDQTENAPFLQYSVTLSEKVGHLLGVIEMLEEVLRKNRSYRLVWEWQALATIVETVHVGAFEHVDIYPTGLAMHTRRDVDQHIFRVLVLSPNKAAFETKQS